METEVQNMVTGRIHSKNFGGQHVGNKGERNPEVGLGGVVKKIGGEGPSDSFPCQSGRDMGIGVDIQVIIKLDEFKIPDRPIYRQSCGNKRQTDQPV